MPKALDVDWTAIKLEFSQGTTLEQLSERYGVKMGSLCARSAREKWATYRPETHARVLHQALQETARVQGETLAQRGQAYAERMFSKVSKLAEEANLAPPKNYKDLEIADKVARRAAGLENIESQVNTVVGVNLLDHIPGDLPVIEAEFVKEVDKPAEVTE